MVHARTAVLLALRQGPGYGSQLLRRIRESSRGALRLALGSLYPALKELQRARLVRSWTVVPGRRRGGRARRYYELTERGVRASEAAEVAIAGLLDIGPRPKSDSVKAIEERMRRLELAAELSETQIWLKDRVSGRGRRGAA